MKAILITIVAVLFFAFSANAQNNEKTENKTKIETKIETKIKKDSVSTTREDVVVYKTVRLELVTDDNDCNHATESNNKAIRKNKKKSKSSK